MIIELNGISIKILRKAIKNINLRIYPPDGSVQVSVPLRISEAKIRQTLEQKITWIQKQHELIRKRSAAENTPLATGSSILFMGKKYSLIIEEQHGPKQMRVDQECIYCYIPPKTSQTHLQALIDMWYKQQMSLILPPIIVHWEQIVGVKVSEWKIKKMRTRWGSCNTRVGRIWLNLNLIKKPRECLEYVLVHELVHLHEPSHNKRFYRLMNQFMPQWQEYQYLLEQRYIS